MNDSSAETDRPGLPRRSATLILDPRRGDMGDDRSATKQRSLLAMFGSLLAEISLPKLFSPGRSRSCCRPCCSALRRSLSPPGSEIVDPSRGGHRNGRRPGRSRLLFHRLARLAPPVSHGGEELLVVERACGPTRLRTLARGVAPSDRSAGSRAGPAPSWRACARQAAPPPACSCSPWRARSPSSHGPRRTGSARSTI